MGDYIIGYPVDSKNFVNSEENFARTGEDGAEHIFSLFGTDKFFGEVLEGKWTKDDDGVIVGPFTALITGGDLQLTGEAAVAGNSDRGWIQSKNRLYMFDDTVVDIHMKLPSLATANTFALQLFFTATTGSPILDSDFIYVRLKASSTQYLIQIQKEIAGTGTSLLADTEVTNAEGTWRIKFEETKDGHTQTHIYFHDGAGAIVEATDEVTGSPFTLGLNFNKAYISFLLNTDEDTTRIVSSEHITVTYPDFLTQYDLDDADVNKGDCKIFDGDPSDSGVQVFDEDHDFS